MAEGQYQYDSRNGRNKKFIEYNDLYNPVTGSSIDFPYADFFYSLLDYEEYKTDQSKAYN